MKKELSVQFANRVASALALNLKASDFYITYCHEMRAVAITTAPKPFCSACEQYHTPLKIDRSTAKRLANKEIPREVEEFVARESGVVL
jgi:hypothetical protein